MRFCHNSDPDTLPADYSSPDTNELRRLTYCVGLFANHNHRVGLCGFSLFKQTPPQGDCVDVHGNAPGL